jgi:hypothetical protein
MDGYAQHFTSGRCPYCGSSDLALGLKANQNAEVGTIGLAYKAAKIFVGTELLRADLCLSCGSVVRFFVKESKRNWIQDKD